MQCFRHSDLSYDPAPSPSELDIRKTVDLSLCIVPPHLPVHLAPEAFREFQESWPTACSLTLVNPTDCEAAQASKAGMHSGAHTVRR